MNKICGLFISLLLVHGCVLAQNKRYIDSLKTVLEVPNISHEARLDVLIQIARFTSEPEEKIAFASTVLEEIQASDSAKYEILAYHSIGVAERLQGHLEQSLDWLLKSSQLAIDHNELDFLAEAYGEIATTYAANADQNNALIFDNKAIDLFRQLGKYRQLSINLLNTGYTYYEREQYDTALMYYNEAAFWFDSLGLTIGKAYNLGNRALVFWKTGDLTAAEKDLLQAIEMLLPLGDQYGMADFHNQLGDLYLESGEIEKSIYHTRRSLEMAEALGLKEQARDASLLLSKLSRERGNYQEAYRFHQEYVAYRDSIQNDETTKAMADLRTEFEVSLREKEIEVLEKDKQLQSIYNIVAVVLLVAFILLFLLSRQRLMNNKLAAKAERDQLAAKAERARHEHEKEVQNLLQGQEKKALQSMITGREKERKHLAGELHNHLGSLLATAKMNLNGIEHDDPRINTLHDLVDQVYNDIRNLSHALNMGVSEDFGLISALKELVEHLSHAGKLNVEFNAAVGDCHIPFEQEIVIYRVIQELVSNILKHAGATEMSLLLTCFEDDHLLNIMVSDNGKGFDANTVSGKSEGMGLNSLEGMITGLRGDMEIDSVPGKGTTVNIDLPLEEFLIENDLNP